MIEWRLPECPEPDASPAIGERVVLLQSCGDGGDLLLCLAAAFTTSVEYWANLQPR